MTEIERCHETIASYVLDSGETISYRTLAVQSVGDSALHDLALRRFVEQNANGVAALNVVVRRGGNQPHTDPRARVISLTSNTLQKDAEKESFAQVYGVFPKLTGDECPSIQALATALWAQERKLRNEIFDKVDKSQPLSRELKALYASDLSCKEATSRTDVGENQGEEAVSIFDSMTTSRSSAPSHTKHGSTGSTASKPVAAKSSFFKNNPPSKPKSTTISQPSRPSKSETSKTETKHIDASSMSHVFTIDSDDEEDESDGGAPSFVKKATPFSRSKRVLIDEDEDEDIVDELPPKPKVAAAISSPSKSSASTTRNVKRKLETTNTSTPKVNLNVNEEVVLSKGQSKKRNRVIDDEEQEATFHNQDAEMAAEPSAEDEQDLLQQDGTVKRRQLVKKMEFTEDGYLKSVETWEEVEVSVEQLAKEREERRKKEASQKASAAAAAEKARKAAAAAKSGTKKGAPQQKKLDFFFGRK